MAGNGPPPNPNAIRRNPRVGMLRLPASGRPGRPPKWPLPGRKRAGETEAWRELWKTPQAVAWERFGWTRTVARYCRVMIQAESLSPFAKDAWAEARLLEKELGLTPSAMRSLMWVVDEDETQRRREQKAAEGKPEKPTTRRLRAVDPGA